MGFSTRLSEMAYVSRNAATQPRIKCCSDLNGRRPIGVRLTIAKDQATATTKRKRKKYPTPAQNRVSND